MRGNDGGASPRRCLARVLAYYLLLGLAALSVWVALYLLLKPFADRVTFRLLGLPPAAMRRCPRISVPAASLTRPSPARPASAPRCGFTAYEVPKVLLLLVLVVFAVGVVRSFFTPERTRGLLIGRREWPGNVLAALLGTVTPFCSCSAVPLFIGFVTAGVPLGVTFSFLISAPMVNEVALVLLFGLFGWKVAALYLGTGLVIAILAGWVIGRLHPERQVEGWVYRDAGGGGGRRRGAARCRGPPALWPAARWGRSSAGCGPSSSPASPSARRFTVMCREGSWPR